MVARWARHRAGDRRCTVRGRDGERKIVHRHGDLAPFDQSLPSGASGPAARLRMDLLTCPCQAQVKARELPRYLHEHRVYAEPGGTGSARCWRGWGSRRLPLQLWLRFTLGRPDAKATLAEVIEHVRALRRYSHSSRVGRSGERLRARTRRRPPAIERAAGAGAVGGSIEDCGPDSRSHP